MHGFVLFLHFFGLMLGAAGTFGAFVIMRRAQKAPAAEAETLRKVGWPLAMVSGAGLVVLWITGIMMLVASGHAGTCRWCSGWKIVFVVIADGAERPDPSHLCADAAHGQCRRSPSA